MKRKYLITSEQLESISHFKRMFEMNAQIIKELCSSEKDDIVYGFELGERHSHLRDCFMEMLNLESEIIENNEVFDPDQESINFIESTLNKVNSFLSDDYKTGFREGVENYITKKYGK